jgi:ribosomal protein L9
VTGDVVKDVGSHEFTVEIHAEVSVPVTVEVQAEA